MNQVLLPFRPNLCVPTDLIFVEFTWLSSDSLSFPTRLFLALSASKIPVPAIH